MQVDMRVLGTSSKFTSCRSHLYYYMIQHFKYVLLIDCMNLLLSGQGAIMFDSCILSISPQMSSDVCLEGEMSPNVLGHQCAVEPHPGKVVNTAEP